jgi:uncharacterized RDD family membrane protein YckC
MDTAPVKKIADTLLSYGRKKTKPRDKYAGFNRRMLAASIDSFILLLFLPLINRLSPINTEALGGYSVDPGDPQASSHLLMHILGNQEFLVSWFANFFMQILFWCVYSTIFLHFYSATPGKILLRMKVVDAKTEGQISDLQVFGRSFGYLVSATFGCLGFLWIGLNKRKRGWHDYLGDTVVINLPLTFAMPWSKKKAPVESPDNTVEKP